MDLPALDLPTMDLQALLAAVGQPRVEPPGASRCCWNFSTAEAAAPEDQAHYANRDPALGIDFRVDRILRDGLQVMDPRLVRIAPGASNERHRHAHESIFVVLAGRGEILIGAEALPLQAGSVACVPRWVVHQSRNTSPEEPLLLLAITDFGLTSAVLGDYDARTRLKSGGAQAFPRP